MSRRDYWHIHCSTREQLRRRRRDQEHPVPELFYLTQNDFRAVKCAKCGTKIYPAALLDVHVVRHKKRDRWFNDDLRKLQHTFWHMREPA